jgi:GT2 family glycosyltransferase
MVNRISSGTARDGPTLCVWVKGKFGAAGYGQRLFEAATKRHMQAQDQAPAGVQTRYGGPAVSVIVPCYNGGRFLDGLMASLDRQTFRDFEIVVVNDGSTDATTRNKLVEIEGHARVVHQPNSGPSAARNAGLRAAKADIVFMLDCDDTIEPSFLADTVPLLRYAAPDVGMVFTHLRLTGAETGVVPRYFNRFDLLFTNTLSSGLVLRKAACLAAGGYDETMREGYEDWDFSLRLMRAGYRGMEVPKPLYVYHIAERSDASRSSGVDRQRLYGRLWRALRKKHAALYRPATMLALWRTSAGGHVPLWKGVAAYAATLFLPDSLFNSLIAHLHRRHRADKSVPAYGGAAGAPRLAP